MIKNLLPFFIFCFIVFSNFEASYKNVSKSIILEQETFNLPKPNMDKIKLQCLNNGNSHLLQYLNNNFKEIKSVTNKFEGECALEKEFLNHIIYNQNECSSGISNYQLTIPLVKISELKLLFAKLFYSDDYYHWNKDSLRHKTDDNGNNGSGGDYLYKIFKDRIEITISYTD